MDPSARQRTGHRLVGLLVVVCLLAAAVLALLGSAAQSADLPDRLMIFLLVGSDTEVNYGQADAARHETNLAIAWLESQVGQRFDRGVDFAELVQLDVAADGLGQDPYLAYLHLINHVREHTGNPSIFPVVLADVRTDDARASWLTCGMGSPQGLVLFLDNCAETHPSVTSTWGSPASTTIAHELVHGLGAVEACAPHATADGHVDDDPNDVVYHRSSWGHRSGVTLDAGRDDYLGHGIPGCADIADSPLWR